MRDIIDGFLRFQREVYPQRVELFKQLATTQHPKALFVTCSDSAFGFCAVASCLKSSTRCG